MKVKSVSEDPEFDFDLAFAPLYPPHPLSHAETLDWLRLLRTPQIGAVTFWTLLGRFGSAAAAIAHFQQSVKSGRTTLPEGIVSYEAAEREFERAHACGIRLIAISAPEYPPLLRQVDMPPPLLYIKGEGVIWDHPPIAVVGSRKASGVGLKLAAELSHALSADGFRVISGLARGIDAAAHQAALPWGTAAVLPGGLDAIYPSDHEGLAADIEKTGLLISECPPGFLARAQDFPRRNRIISGCSLGTLVVEATEKSGSLITARYAVEQNREVFAVPGHPLEPKAKGTNALLRKGATLITCVEDIKDVLKLACETWGLEHAPSPTQLTVNEQQQSYIAQPGASLRAQSLKATGDASEAAQILLDVLSLTPIDIDDLVRITGLDARYVQVGLLELDLNGRLDRQGQRLVALKA